MDTACRAPGGVRQPLAAEEGWGVSPCPCGPPEVQTCLRSHTRLWAWCPSLAASGTCALWTPSGGAGGYWTGTHMRTHEDTSRTSLTESICSSLDVFLVSRPRHRLGPPALLLLGHVILDKSQGSLVTTTKLEKAGTGKEGRRYLKVWVGLPVVHLVTGGQFDRLSGGSFPHSDATHHNTANIREIKATGSFWTPSTGAGPCPDPPAQTKPLISVPDSASVWTHSARPGSSSPGKSRL